MPCDAVRRDATKWEEERDDEGRAQACVGSRRAVRCGGRAGALRRGGRAMGRAIGEGREVLKISA